jgi:hypothetical protein
LRLLGPGSFATVQACVIDIANRSGIGPAALHRAPKPFAESRRRGRPRDRTALDAAWNDGGQRPR